MSYVKYITTFLFTFKRCWWGGGGGEGGSKWKMQETHCFCNSYKSMVIKQKEHHASGRNIYVYVYVHI